MLMKLLLILLLASAVLAYKIKWQCGKCEDTVSSDYCYSITGDPFINATIQLDSSINSCSQTGMSFPMNYEFSSCNSGNCSSSFSTLG